MSSQSTAYLNNSDQWPSFDGYSPLNSSKREIRLLRVGRDLTSNTLQCDLHHHSLDEKPKYFALSYYWGAPPSNSDLELIYVNSLPVKIRPTLYSFLLQLVQHFKYPAVWLDVICIDQNHISERNEQVSMMADIFRTAEGVYAWLGNGDPDPDFAMRHIETCIGHRSHSDMSDSQCQVLLESVDQICRRPYWRRVWVMQEIALARELWIFCGSKLCRWENFVACVKDLREAPTDSLYNPLNLLAHASAGVENALEKVIQKAPRKHISELNTTRERMQRGHLMRLASVVESFKDLQCTDARDRLFGLRAFASDGHLLKVDYSLTLYEAFISFISSLSSSFEGVNFCDHALLAMGVKICSHLEIDARDFRNHFEPRNSDSIVAAFKVKPGKFSFGSEADGNNWIRWKDSSHPTWSLSLMPKLYPYDRPLVCLPQPLKGPHPDDYGKRRWVRSFQVCSLNEISSTGAVERNFRVPDVAEFRNYDKARELSRPEIDHFGMVRLHMDRALFIYAVLLKDNPVGIPYLEAYLRKVRDGEISQRLCYCTPEDDDDKVERLRSQRGDSSERVMLVHFKRKCLSSLQCFWEDEIEGPKQTSVYQRKNPE